MAHSQPCLRARSRPTEVEGQGRGPSSGIWESTSHPKSSRPRSTETPSRDRRAGVAHTYDTGGMRRLRLHLRGRGNILKRLLIHVAGFNLSLIMRKLYWVRAPRGGFAALLKCLRNLFQALLCTMGAEVTGFTRCWPSLFFHTMSFTPANIAPRPNPS